MISKIQDQQFFLFIEKSVQKKNYKNLLTVDGCTCIGLLTDNPFKSKSKQKTKISGQKRITR